MLDLRCYRFLQSARRGPRPGSVEFSNGAIEPKGYGFKLNSAMKLTEATLTSTWRVNPRCFETAKFGESALSLIAKAAFDAKPLLVLQGLQLWSQATPLPMMY
jgi:hypothetical protein